MIGAERTQDILKFPSSVQLPQSKSFLRSAICMCSIVPDNADVLFHYNLYIYIYISAAEDNYDLHASIWAWFGREKQLTGFRRPLVSMAGTKCSGLILSSALLPVSSVVALSTVNECEHTALKQTI